MPLRGTLTGFRLPPAPLSAAYLVGLAELVDQLPVIACSTDRDLRFTSATGGAVPNLGRRPEELIGLTLAEFFGDADYPSIAIHAQALDGETVAYSCEWNARAYDVTVRPLHAVDGSIIGTVGLAIDVTQRKLAEAALSTSEAHYRAFVEEAPVGIFRSSPEGRFLEVNPALVAMLGYAGAGELMGVNIAADVYVDPTLRGRLTTAYAQAERVSGVDVEWRRRDGSAITVRLSGRPVRAAGGALVAWQMIAEDVTEFRRVEMQLRQAQKMEAVGRLTGGLAHDFNNILTAILANADLIDAALPESAADVRADLGDITAAARRGSDLVRKLLGFSRRERLQVLPTTLGDSLAAIAARLRPSLPATVTVTVTVAAAVPAAMADVTAVEQIVGSLALNARDAMPRGGTLHITLDRVILDEQYRQAHGWGTPGEYVTVVVRDTGVGMDEDTRARAFEPFFTTKPPGASSGLGLSMVYGLMKQMNGFVRLESEAGCGTRVTLFFPLTRSRVTPQGQAVHEPAGTGLVLVVEDEEPVRRVARRVLERFGYRVIVAADGEEALRIYEERKADIGLVLTDIVMPHMGGRELYEALRGRGATVPVMFTSGYTRRGGADGAAGGLDPSVPFLAKPWSAEELVRRVREVIRA